jgi:hypothetical protein
VIIIEPVIETFDAKGFTVWPVGVHPGSEGLALSGELAPVDVGTVMAVIAVYNHNHIAPSARRMSTPDRPGSSSASLRRTT